MKIRNLLLSLSFLPLLANAQGEYKLVWEDDFNGDKLDTSVWTAEKSTRFLTFYQTNPFLTNFLRKFLIHCRRF